jgi:predicted HTH domain antitoxin
LEGRITREEAALHLAIGLYASDKVTLGQAAAVAGISQPELLQRLGERKIAVHYDLEHLEQDIATVQSIAGCVNPR